MVFETKQILLPEPLRKKLYTEMVIFRTISARKKHVPAPYNFG